MDLKQPLSFEDQVNKLIAHGLEITDRERAKEILSQINYYRFTGYALQFRKNPMISDYFPGVAFEQVYKIYLFDEELQSPVKQRASPERTARLSGTNGVKRRHTFSGAQHLLNY